MRITSSALTFILSVTTLSLASPILEIRSSRSPFFMPMILKSAKRGLSTMAISTKRLLPSNFVKNISTQPGSHHNGIINPSLNEEIEQWQPDAVLVFGWNFVSHFRCIRYFHNKIPVLFRGDSTLLRKQSLIKLVARQLYLKWVYSFIDYVLYVGTENKKYFL